MGLDEKILARIDELIVVGQQLLQTRKSYPDNFIGFDDYVDDGIAAQWGVSCLNLLRRAFGANSDHFVAFSANAEKFGDHGPVKRALGVLRAAKEDYEQGMLFDTRALIAAEVFDDFLGQADHLLEYHYYHPAAVVAGAVLEDGLRKLCGKHGVQLQPKAKAETMNAELARAGVYNVLAQKQITALTDLRNKAAHGQWTEFTEADVKTMLPQIRDFMARHFS